MKHGVWSVDEHDRFLFAIKNNPHGPWGCIAAAVRTRSIRQVQTHTQKYYEKIMRRVRGLRKDRNTWARVEHRIDHDILTFCDFMKNMGSSKARVGDSYTLIIDNHLTVSPPSSTSSSLCTSPVQFQLNVDVSSFIPGKEPEAVGSPSNAPQLDLPPLDEALDFLIHVMEQ